MRLEARDEARNARICGMSVIFLKYWTNEGELYVAREWCNVPLKDWTGNGVWFKVAREA